MLENIQYQASENVPESACAHRRGNCSSWQGGKWLSPCIWQGNRTCFTNTATLEQWQGANSHGKRLRAASTSKANSPPKTHDTGSFHLILAATSSNEMETCISIWRKQATTQGKAGTREGLGLLLAVWQILQTVAQLVTMMVVVLLAIRMMVGGLHKHRAKPKEVFQEQRDKPALTFWETTWKGNLNVEVCKPTSKM